MFRVRARIRVRPRGVRVRCLGLGIPQVMRDHNERRSGPCLVRVRGTVGVGFGLGFG